MTNLKGALGIIERNSTVRFIFNPKELQLSRRITVEGRSATLKVVLDELLAPLHIRYEVTGKQIALFKDPATSQLLLPISVAAESAKQVVTGTVSDENGAGLPGVSVVVKNSQRGTTTNGTGKFSLTIPDGSTDATLVFSFVGYLSQEVVVGSKSVVDISLKSDNKLLNEFVVVGYGTVKKSDLTGAVARVSETDIKATPIVALDRALQGRAAGVQVIQNSARPGGAATIRIRRAGSVNASNDPLYVIDGYPTGGLNSVNPSDIESIEVLKDASATAIYGSRGSNGGLVDKQFICVIPRLRYTPYYKIHKTEPTAEELRRAGISDQFKEVDHAKLREVIIAWVRKTGLKVLACPEMTHEMAVAKEFLVDPLPDDVKKNVVWRETYWLPDEATSVYERARVVISIEMHSPIMAFQVDTPAFLIRQPTDTSKGQMWRDVGLNDWIFEIDSTTGQQITDRLRDVHENYPTALKTLVSARSFVKKRQQEMASEVEKVVRA